MNRLGIVFVDEVVSRRRLRCYGQVKCKDKVECKDKGLTGYWLAGNYRLREKMVMGEVASFRQGGCSESRQVEEFDNWKLSKTVSVRLRGYDSLRIALYY